MPVVLFFHYGGRTELLDLLAGYTPLVEPCGEHVFAELQAESLPDFLTRAGLAGAQLSVGAGANPLVAKTVLTAGQYTGRRGGVVIRRRTAAGLILQVPLGAEAAFMSGLPVESLWPLSIKTIRRLRDLGLVAVGDVARVGDRELRARFGAEGALIAAYSRGRDHRRVRALYPPPEVVWTLGLERVHCRGELEHVLAVGAERIAADLRAEAEGYRHLALSLLLENGRTVEAERDYTEGVPDPLRMRIRLGMLLSLTAVQAPVTEVRITAGKLYPLQSGQLDLFMLQRPSEEALLQTLGAVNLKYPGKLTRGCKREVSVFRRERMRELYVQ